MPLYEYQCKECDAIMEVSQKLSDNKLEEYECSQCKCVKPVKKIITSMNFELKGRGWSYDGYTSSYDQVKDLI